MKLQIQSIHFDADKRLLEYVQEKCDKLDKFFDRIIDGQVVMKIEKDSNGVGNKMLELRVNVPNDQLLVKERGDKFEECTDLAIESMKRQVKKYKDKLLA